MDAEAKILSVDYRNANNDDPLVTITLTVWSDDTTEVPDIVTITWSHFLGHLRENLDPYLYKALGDAASEGIIALNSLIHPDLGRLFPYPETDQVLTRRELMKDYGISLPAIRRLPPNATIIGWRRGAKGRKARRMRLYVPEHPAVRALMPVPHEELHGDQEGYDS